MRTLKNSIRLDRYSVIHKIPSIFSGIKVDGHFYCRSLNRLKTLEGSPSIVTGDFSCASSNVVSLVGGPVRVEGEYDCTWCSLTSLEGAPEYVGAGFYCYGNKTLTSLEGAPKYVGGVFSTSGGGGKRFTEAEVRAVCEVKGKVYV